MFRTPCFARLYTTGDGDDRLVRGELRVVLFHRGILEYGEYIFVQWAVFRLKSRILPSVHRSHLYSTIPFCRVSSCDSRKAAHHDMLCKILMARRLTVLSGIEVRCLFF